MEWNEQAYYAEMTSLSGAVALLIEWEEALENDGHRPGVQACLG